MSEYLKTLKTNPKNPRTITKQAFEELKDKLRRVPQGLDANKIVFKDGVIMAGNQRFKALQELAKEGFTVKDDYFVDATNWTDEQIREYVITSNVSDGEWDWDILANEWSIDDLNKWGVKNIQAFTEDEVEEVEQIDADGGQTFSELGKIYQLGKHRIACGDSTDSDLVAKLFKNKRAGVLFTSPPYNMGYSKTYKKYEDNRQSEEYIKFNIDVVSLWRGFLEGYLFWNISYNKNAPTEFMQIMHEIIHNNGMKFIDLICWYKRGAFHVPTPDRLTRTYEPILLVGNDDKVNNELEYYIVTDEGGRGFYNKKVGKYITNFWDIPTNSPNMTKMNKACFPIKLPTRAILMTTEKNEIVADPFLGSGTTLLAAEQTGRICYGCELDEKLVDVIRKRYWKFITGDEKGWQNGTKAV